MVYVMALNLPHCYLSLIQTRRIPQRQTKRNSSSNPNLAGSNVYLNWRKGKCCLARVVCMFPVVTLNKKPGAGDHAGESKGWFIVRPDFWDWSPIPSLRRLPQNRRDPKIKKSNRKHCKLWFHWGNMFKYPSISRDGISSWWDHEARSLWLHRDVRSPKTGRVTRGCEAETAAGIPVELRVV